jgi:hypothetical protein
MGQLRTPCCPDKHQTLQVGEGEFFGKVIGLKNSGIANHRHETFAGQAGPFAVRRSLLIQKASQRPVNRFSFPHPFSLRVRAIYDFNGLPLCDAAIHEDFRSQ